MSADPYILPYTKVNSEWSKKLKIRPEAMQILKEYLGSTFQHISTGNDFLNRTSKVQEVMSNIKEMVMNSKHSAQQNNQFRM